MSEISDHEAVTRIDDDRVSIPLMMLDGNLECLIENDIEVETISLKWYGLAGVVLTVGMSEEQKVIAAEKGFRTSAIQEPK